jgi:O-antigen ligase
MAGLPAAELAAAAGALLLLFLAGRFALAEPEAFWWATVALAPLAVPWRTPLHGVEVSVPFEPMLVLSGIGLLRHAARPEGGWPSLLRHPVLLAASASVAWMAASSLAAPDPLAGLKATVVRGLYAAVLLGGGLVFLRPEGAVRRLAVVASASLLPVALFVLAAHAAVRFDRRAAYEIAQPFFSNRLDLVALLTVWGVVAAVLLLSRGRSGAGAGEGRLLAVFLLLAAALLVTLFARSALVGAAAALVAGPLLTGRTSPRRAVAALATVFTLAVFLAAFFVSSRSARLAPEPPPGPFSPLVDAVLELPPLRDASVLERANRWATAARMAADRPLAGFGPNGFEKAYGPWQRPAETTVDSSFSGGRGDAHSEYVSALVEQGVVGLGLLLALLGTLLAAGVRAARGAGSPERRATAVAFTAGLVAFAAMNLFNSFLDLDKVAPAFWLVAAAIVTGDRSRVSGPAARPTSPEGC